MVRRVVRFAGSVDDVDAVFQKAVNRGWSPIMAPVERPWGDRVGGFHDPNDNRWWVASHVGNLA